MTNLQKKKIGILCGGWSSEREISLLSGNNVYQCLVNNNFDAHLLDLKENNKNRDNWYIMLDKFINKNSINLVFNLIHGNGGEDGIIQTYLDKLNVKYVGSDAASSTKSFDKIITKNIWNTHNLPTPKFILLDETYSKIKSHIGSPFIVKPIKSGSSVDIEIIKSELEFHSYTKKIKILKDYFAEELIKGGEYTAPIIGNDVFPIIQIETKREFYDYNAKYIDEDTIFTFPKFEKNYLAHINILMNKAFSTVGCTGWGRVDFFIDEKENIQLIEVNSIPGMPGHSLVPMSAKKNNLSFLELLEIILSHT